MDGTMDCLFYFSVDERIDSDGMTGQRLFEWRERSKMDSPAKLGSGKDDWAMDSTSKTRGTIKKRERSVDRSLLVFHIGNVVVVVLFA